MRLMIVLVVGLFSSLVHAGSNDERLDAVLLSSRLDDRITEGMLSKPDVDKKPVEKLQVSAINDSEAQAAAARVSAKSRDAARILKKKRLAAFRIPASK